ARPGRFRRPARLPSGRAAAPHRVEGVRARRATALEALRGRAARRAVVLVRRARRPRPRAAAVGAVPLGAGRGARRRALRAAPARRHDRAGRRRRAPARVPRGARAVRGRAVSAALPGDTRLSGDRLAWLLASLALVLVPHATRLPFWITGAFVVLAVWRLGAWRARWPLPPAWLRATLAVLGFA